MQNAPYRYEVRFGGAFNQRSIWTNDQATANEVRDRLQPHYTVNVTDHIELAVTDVMSKIGPNWAPEELIEKVLTALRR